MTTTEVLSNGTKHVTTEVFKINNILDVTVTVGDYKVFVSTRGNTQVRQIYIVK